jgi:hypothetical protein
MEKAVQSLVGLLREQGVKVSQAELIDALESLARLRLDQRSTVKDALRAALAKRVQDIPVFDVLFDVCFPTGHEPGLGLPAPADPLQRILRDRIAQAKMSENLEISKISELVLTGQLGALFRLVTQEAQALGIDRMTSAPLRGGALLGKLQRRLDLGQVRTDAENLLAGLHDRGRDIVPHVLNGVDQLVQRLNEELSAIVRREVDKKRFLTLQRIDSRELAAQPIYAMTESEVSAIRPVVERLARRIRDRLSLKLKAAELGRFDSGRTIRKNLGLDGSLAELCFRAKKPAKPQVAALCDVSRSVRTFSRFMLLLLYSLRQVISRLKSFIFVGDLVEVTDLFRRCDRDTAISMAAAGRGLKYPVGTDYGSSLAQFVAEHLSAVGSRTTIIILGDARNNNLAPRLEAMETLAKKARRVIWLNPEPHLNWNLGDSVMQLYAPYCTKVLECGTIAQLSRAIEENLLP